MLPPSLVTRHSEGSLQGAGWKGVTLAPEELSTLYVGGHSWGNQITLRTPEALELRGRVWKAPRVSWHAAAAGSPLFTVPCWARNN